MTQQPVNLSLVAEEDIAAEAVEPKIFVRTVSAPAGMPWNQARIAALEARLGAPLPLSEVVYQLRRLESWRPGRTARYATFYVRAQDVAGSLNATVDVDGAPVAVQFLSAGEQSRRARRLLIIAAVAAGLALIVMTAITAALAARAQTDERLTAAEHTALVRLKQAEAEQRLKAQTGALDSAGVDGHRTGDLFRDLSWASAAKAPGAHIQALHWDHGNMAVEVRGGSEPFVQPDRAVVKVPKPIRQGVWLWGVTAAAQPSAPAQRRTMAPLPSTDYGNFGGAQ